MLDARIAYGTAEITLLRVMAQSASMGSRCSSINKPTVMADKLTGKTWTQTSKVVQFGDKQRTARRWVRRVQCWRAEQTLPDDGERLRMRRQVRKLKQVWVVCVCVCWLRGSLRAPGGGMENCSGVRYGGGGGETRLYTCLLCHHLESCWKSDKEIRPRLPD